MAVSIARVVSGPHVNEVGRVLGADGRLVLVKLPGGAVWLDVRDVRFERFDRARYMAHLRRKLARHETGSRD